MEKTFREGQGPPWAVEPLRKEERLENVGKTAIYEMERVSNREICLKLDLSLMCHHPPRASLRNQDSRKQNSRNLDLRFSDQRHK
ncbi:hypothetical protein TNCV_1088831 [Trichonephila clavipes]|uniref:Uncharacterized protein n=1 Tax=Trichonephila clavipes TaxID=2585209 RepID=A0A8X6VFW6_TRICX|nr:hypothetical protein TNCV_1088831 [Trichonephila clavipes]